MTREQQAYDVARWLYVTARRRNGIEGTYSPEAQSHLYPSQIARGDSVPGTNGVTRAGIADRLDVIAGLFDE